MRYLVLLILGLSIFNGIKCQDTISKEFIKHRSKYGNIVPEKKAKFIKYIIKGLDSSLIYEVYSLKTKQLVLRESEKNGIQVGKWIYYNDNGDLEQELDFDFSIDYDFQKVDSICNNKGGFTIVYDDAQFSEGNFREYIQTKMIYPIAAAEGNIQGKVIIVFLVDKTGLITDICIKQKLHPIIEKECVRAIRNSPKWIPAKINGKEVVSCQEIPLIFQLQ